MIARRHGWYRRDIESDDLDDVRTDAQKEWARWAASGYAKRWQPRSMLWLGGIFVTLLIAGLFTVIWLSAHGRL